MFYLQKEAFGQIVCRLLCCKKGLLTGLYVANEEGACVILCLDIIRW